MIDVTKIDLRRDPARGAAARAKGQRSNHDKAVSAYAPLAPRVIEMRLGMMSLAAIAAKLNEEGNRTRNGAMFNAKLISVIIGRAAGAHRVAAQPTALV